MYTLVSTRLRGENVRVELEDALMTSPGSDRTEPVDVSPQDDFLLYDGECPFCSLYARKSRFETQTGRPLRLIDAGRATGLVDKLRREGCDIEDGMILILDGRRYQGASAMTALEAMTSGDDWFNRLMKWLSSSPRRARILYPWLRMLRRAALWVKGRSRRSRVGRN